VSYRGPRGTYDVYPGGREPHERPELWRWVESVATEAFRRYGYAEIRTPVFEDAELFVRSVGEASDIVRKEMFVFEDKAGRELSLRPEGTAGVVRAYVEHSLFKAAQPIKLFYRGPMFRHERQQKGRYRQHTQIGVEVLGSDDPLVDVEVIHLLYSIHQAVGVRDEVVYLNNLGDLETRRRYVPELRAFLQKHRGDLDPDSVARLETNPLRTFDSKDTNTQALLREAPSLGEFLSEGAAAHMDTVMEGLKALGVPHEVDERLVRGLDYYTLTVFEAKSAALGAQDTVGGGGRYNGLVSELGGPDVPGIGFGSGIERILLAATPPGLESALDVYVVALSAAARVPAMRLVGAMRGLGVACDLDYGGRGAKGQFRQADRSGAGWTVILGDDELREGVAKLRNMSSGEEQATPLEGAEREISRLLQPR
jgi:histidyl-tRNA synthetase